MTSGLEVWLREATRHLAKDSTAQVLAEIQEHYEAAHEAAMMNGATSDEAMSLALNALGSATSREPAISPCSADVGRGENAPRRQLGGEFLLRAALAEMADCDRIAIQWCICCCDRDCIALQRSARSAGPAAGGNRIESAVGCAASAHKHSLARPNLPVGEMGDDDRRTCADSRAGNAELVVAASFVFMAARLERMDTCIGAAETSHFGMAEALVPLRGSQNVDCTRGQNSECAQ